MVAEKGLSKVRKSIDATPVSRTIISLPMKVQTDFSSWTKNWVEREDGTQIILAEFKVGYLCERQLHLPLLRMTTIKREVSQKNFLNGVSAFVKNARMQNSTSQKYGQGLKLFSDFVNKYTNWSNCTLA